MLDNFIKGPLTSLIGLVFMLSAGYGWWIEWLTDLQGAVAALAGFTLLFMRDKLPDFITQLVTALLDKFFPNRKK